MASPFDLGFAYGLGFQKGNRKGSNPKIRVLVFDYEKVPAGFSWKTINNEKVLISPSGFQFRPITSQRAETVCSNIEKSIKSSHDSKQIKKLLKTASSLLAGYIECDIQGTSHPVLFNQIFFSEIGRYFKKLGKKGPVENHKAEALGRLEGLKNIVAIIQNGGNITPSSTSWNYDPKRHEEYEFYTVGAKIVTLPSGRQRFILDLARNVDRDNPPIIAYHLNFEGGIDYPMKRSSMTAQAAENGKTETLKFFED